MPHPYLALEHPLRLAHRGSRLLWPENTAYAFQRAIDLGYRYIETDVQLTRDDVVVVLHDHTLDRTTNAIGPVRDWLWEDLHHLDAAWRFGESEGFPLRGTGIGISRLEDVLSTWPGVHFNVDLKAPGLEWPVAEVLARTKRADGVLVAAFSDRRLARFRRITRGMVATSAGPVAAIRAWVASRSGRVVRSPPVAYQVPFDNRGMRLDRRFVDAAHRADAQVHAWVVDDAADMTRLLDMGVDGIVTDRPDVLNAVVATRASGD